MGLFSLFRKNKQEESASSQAGYQGRPGDDAAASRTRAKRKAGRDADDAEIPEKKRARRRLIGAIVLVLVVIVALPMVFDPEPNPEIDKIVIQIPSKEQSSPAASRAATDADQQDDDVAAEDLEEIISPVPVAPVAPVAAPAPAVRTPPPVAAVEPVRTAPVQVTPAPAPVVQPKPDDAARALAILEGRGSDNKAAAKPADTGAKFVIQVAALASQDKVAELRKRLSDAGIKSFTQKIATHDGERTRIRVGPFTGKEEAEKMRAKINKLGLSATLVPA